jgi:hypothetical protein
MDSFFCVPNLDIAHLKCYRRPPPSSPRSRIVPKDTTTRSERTDRCRRTRRFGVMCAEQGACVRRRSWAGYTINMFEFEFPTGTTGVDGEQPNNFISAGASHLLNSCNNSVVSLRSLRQNRSRISVILSTADNGGRSSIAALAAMVGLQFAARAHRWLTNGALSQLLESKRQRHVRAPQDLTIGERTSSSSSAAIRSTRALGQQFARPQKAAALLPSTVLQKRPPLLTGNTSRTAMPETSPASKLSTCQLFTVTHSCHRVALDDVYVVQSLYGFVLQV